LPQIQVALSLFSNTLENGAIVRPSKPYEEPARNSPTWPTNGEGFLLYPGVDYGIKGPVGSIRLEACRDGVEDFELITMFANTLGKDKAMEFVNKVTTSVTEYSRDSENFNSVRIEMGNALEAALDK